MIPPRPPQKLEHRVKVTVGVWGLTNGQPYLLQRLGDGIIRRFNESVLAGQPRPRLVTPADLEQAIPRSLDDNAAFEEHWKGAEFYGRRILAALAWVIEESAKRQLDLDGILLVMQDQRLAVERPVVFQRIDDMVTQEILVRDGPTYRFAVPLYSRWIHSRHPPGLVREELG